MSEMWELELDPHQAEVHEPIVDEEIYWEHEMSDEPEQPEMFQERYKDIRVEELILGMDRMLQVNGRDLDGNRVWILLYLSTSTDFRIVG